MQPLVSPAHALHADSRTPEEFKFANTDVCERMNLVAKARLQRAAEPTRARWGDLQGDDEGKTPHPTSGRGGRAKSLRSSKEQHVARRSAAWTENKRSAMAQQQAVLLRKLRAGRLYPEPKWLLLLLLLLLRRCAAGAAGAASVSLLGMLL